ncbi:MAG: hypothetical protein ABSF33_13385 [Acidimicrobiales bacterium]
MKRHAPVGHRRRDAPVEQLGNVRGRDDPIRLGVGVGVDQW